MKKNVNNMKLADNIITILCDDIREEEGNKKSLMGIYSGDYIVHQTEIIIPKLCLAVMINGIKELIKRVKVTFHNPGFDPREIILEAPVISNAESSAPNATLGIIVSPFRIKECGEARFELDFGTEEAPEAIYKFAIKTIDDLKAS
jgi:hypothetical protein